MTAYYNEHDPFAAQWLRNLIAGGMIAPGDVDERSIEDVLPVELYEYTQVHLFAGIGVWSYSMRSAGWPDDRAGWTCSCPCQPFSAAGQGAGFADERHLWPAAFHLVTQCGPVVVLGEQVASSDGLAWLDLVQTDVEAAGYAFGSLDSCAAGFGAPHIRQRLYWLAHANDAGLAQQRRNGGISPGSLGAPPRESIERSGAPISWLADDAEPGRFPWGRAADASNGRGTPREQSGRLCDDSGLANPFHGQFPQAGPRPGGRNGQPGTGQERGRPGPVNGAWDAVDWLRCRDDRWRPVEPGTFPLANGVANRVGLLRGYGNAIVAPQATEFVKVAMDYIP